MRIALLLVLFNISGFAIAQESSFSQKLDANLSELAATGRFNGTVLYAEKGKVIYQKAFGVSDIRTNSPLTMASSFNLASITKQFTAAGIMILQQEGKLQYDDDVKKYLPNFPYKNITVRNLLQHTSGIPDYWSVYMDNRTPVDSLSNESMYTLLIKYQPALEFPTGSSWNYSNTNYVLLAMIIEKISGKYLATFLQEKIIEPAGLKNTYLYHIFMPSTPENHVYGFTTENGENKMNDLFHIDGVYGDGNMYASATDLFKWDQILYTEKIIKQQTFQTALQPAQLSDGDTYPYGFGWFIEKEGELFWHTGSWAGFYNIICRDIKNERTLIVLSSGGNDMGRSMAKEIFFGRAFEIPQTTLINNVQVVDGTGSPARKAAVRIEGDRIIAVGDLKVFANEQVIDGKGKVLAPGFIDSHSHVDRDINNNPTALAAISQGITTIVIGQDGESDPIDSLKKWCTTIPRSVNMATYTGHASLRAMVMGRDELHRIATQKEIDAMIEILDQEMQKGSFGLSTGLEYEEGFYASFDELIQLAKATAAQDGKYISHLRSEDIHFTEAIEEIINIGELADIPVQISHIKIALKDDWGTANTILARLEQARMAGIDITADCYPYDYWHSTIRVLFPNKDFTSMEAATFATEHLFDPTGSIIVRFLPEPNYAGRSVSEIATMRNETNEATLLYLVHAAEQYAKDHPDATYIESIMGKSMSDSDIMPFLSWTHTNLCSDGANGGHPRGYGAFPRFLSYYVREQHIMTLESAINKMTALSAEHVGIHDRGVIAPGFYADLVLLDPETIKDNANTADSKALCDGIEMVWTNGELVYQNKQATNQFPGVFLSR